MKFDRDVNLMQGWEELPSRRRHFYFFTLLILLTILASELYGTASLPPRIQSEPPSPPRLTSNEVYPPPVNL